METAILRASTAFPELPVKKTVWLIGYHEGENRSDRLCRSKTPRHAVAAGAAPGKVCVPANPRGEEATFRIHGE